MNLMKVRPCCERLVTTPDPSRLAESRGSGWEQAAAFAEAVGAPVLMMVIVPVSMFIARESSFERR